MRVIRHQPVWVKLLSSFSSLAATLLVWVLVLLAVGAWAPRNTPVRSQPANLATVACSQEYSGLWSSRQLFQGPDGARRAAAVGCNWQVHCKVSTTTSSTSYQMATTVSACSNTDVVANNAPKFMSSRDMMDHSEAAWSSIDLVAPEKHSHDSPESELHTKDNGQGRSTSIFPPVNN